jgi:Cdc6-like AAA superfamily ATPase
MNFINFNEILERETIEKEITAILRSYDTQKRNLLFKRGIYIQGAPGSGKTEFVTRLLKKLNYDVLRYDAGDVRNKSIIDAITRDNMADKNVMSLFRQDAKTIAIIMDEIDGMNNGDKGGLNSLIRLIRPKKTKKQKMEEISYSPIICISSYHVDKKIKELMKNCSVFDLKKPTATQMSELMLQLMPNLATTLFKNTILPLAEYMQGDLRKLASIFFLYQNQCNMLRSDTLHNIFKQKSYNENTKEITRRLLTNKCSFDEHLMTMNETDRTTVGLLWHENVIDALNAKKPTHVALYSEMLRNICYADYVDRFTFQKQIWQFNEMSSLLKTCYTNKLFHDYQATASTSKFNPKEIRFTKVLTKYSTEYNNSLFIQDICQKLAMDKKDTFAFFYHLRQKHTDEEIQTLLQPNEISKLDISRLYRYLEHYINPDCKKENNVVVEEDLTALDAIGDGIYDEVGCDDDGDFNDNH